MPRAIRLVRDSFPDPPELDTAVSHAVLRRVSDGRESETFRLHRPGAIVAFGPQDTISPGYPAAVRACRERGFAAVERLAGGRAAVYHERTIGFSWSMPAPDPTSGIRDRFETIAAIVTAAFRSIGVDARVGEVPGEYCPGAYSVNARGRTKLMGVGQRLVRAAAHVGGVIVVGESRRVRDILIPVYEALNVTWDPETCGSLEEEIGPVSDEMVEAALIAELQRRYEVIEGGVSAETLDLARDLTGRHVPRA